MWVDWGFLEERSIDDRNRKSSCEQIGVVSLVIDEVSHNKSVIIAGEMNELIYLGYRTSCAKSHEVLLVRNFAHINICALLGEELQLSEVINH
ncbi:hypothetical protein Zmor_003084 [Zophobas morio]|uniref:Uncharacterized protein n=1 Tax=Zophobas morio TaxID=2755281 RepID=A0AA38M0Z4_9CUCU|nr:hypothetical protein Zmor_003084 [Zophobas morio]